MLGSIVLRTPTLALSSLVLASIVAFGLAGCRGRGEAADLVLRGGRVVTLDKACPEATALAARGGRIVAVGSDDDVARFVGRGTRVVDLDGRLAIPGFIEGHGHLLGLARSLRTLDLRGLPTWDAIVARVVEAARTAPEGAWIEGRGWHQEKWTAPPRPSVEGYPVRDALDAASAGHPVVLAHASGHGVIANGVALERAGIGDATPDPPGGRIVRDAAGRATGVLLENAENLVAEAMERERAGRPPEAVRAEVEADVERAGAACLARGITSFQDAGSTFETVDVLKAMADAGRLPLRLWVMLLEPNDALERRMDAYRMIGYGDGFLTVRAIKKYMDGALGSRGAWMLEPYADRPDTSGMNVTPVAEIERTAHLAADHGFQLCVHAIGDRANREVLDLYERVLGSLPDGRERRWRIEHAQHLSPADVPRFAKLGVIASMQGIHCTSDGPWVVERIGERRAAEGAYVWRSLLDSGAVVSNGTDTPVESVDPIPNFRALVTRRMANGEAFHPEQRMTRMEALRASTLSAAYAAFEDDVKGSLAPGKLADVVVLSRDVLTVPDDEILEARVVYTVLGGRVAYERPGSAAKE